MPTVVPAPQTQQIQKKGDVTVNVEVTRFNANRIVQTTERVAPSDNKEFDNYEVENTPAYTVSPDRMLFNVRVKNDQARILKLADVAIVFVVDGVSVTIEGGDFKEWVTGLIIPGTEKDYSIKGPKTASLPKSSVVGMYIYDMPVKYDAAGNVTKKDNYEWYFMYSVNQESVEEKITYTYRKEPVYKEVCSQCSGVGHFIVTCKTCAGKGKVLNNKSEVVTCYKCAGNGKVKDDCGNCTDGKIPHRKSGDPSIDERWYGYDITVTTIPAGADLYVMNPDTKEYFRAGTSPAKVRWWEVSSKKPADKYPIRITQGGKTIEVSARANGKVIPKVVVDFSSGSACLVVKGTQVHATSSSY